MNRVMIKICGIRDPRVLEATVKAGADAVGFVLAPSPRRVSAAEAAALLGRLPGAVHGVVVTRQPDRDELDELLELARPDWLQADAESLEGLELPEGCRSLPVYRNRVPERMPGCLLYEGARSGAGELADWELAAALARQTRLVLAGGLHPGNVAAAIARVRPWGVDVSSGVESAPGVKDIEKIREFIAAVRAAESEME